MQAWSVLKVFHKHVHRICKTPELEIEQSTLGFPKYRNPYQASGMRYDCSPLHLQIATSQPAWKLNLPNIALSAPFQTDQLCSRLGHIALCTYTYYSTIYYTVTSKATSLVYICGRVASPNKSGYRQRHFGITCWLHIYPCYNDSQSIQKLDTSSFTYHAYTDIYMCYGYRGKFLFWMARLTV